MQDVARYEATTKTTKQFLLEQAPTRNAYLLLLLGRGVADITVTDRSTPTHIRDYFPLLALY